MFTFYDFSVGIAAEGLGCFLCGIFGVGPGSTSYSINIGLIVVSKASTKSVELILVPKASKKV